MLFEDDSDAPTLATGTLGPPRADGKRLPLEAAEGKSSSSDPPPPRSVRERPCSFQSDLQLEKSPHSWGASARVQGDGRQIEWSKKKARKTFVEGIKIAVVIREHPELLNLSTHSSPLPNAAGCSCFREHVTFSVHCRNCYFACTYKSKVCRQVRDETYKRTTKLTFLNQFWLRFCFIEK